MYYNDFYPDGLTRTAIDRLIGEVFETTTEDGAAPTSKLLLDGTAARRWSRRTTRQAVTGVVRTLPHHQADTGTDDVEDQVA